MKKGPWFISIIALVGLICTIPLGVTAQQVDSWDTYQTTWTEINYKNATSVWIQHPVNGSLVSDNQKLNFIVVPFDADEHFYKVDVYKNNIHMYTCNQEQVYDLYIYTTNPINQIVTIIFKLNGETVLKLEYLAILLTPSLDADFTAQWLLYQAEKENQSLSGRELVSMKEKAFSDIKLTLTTGLLCIAFTTIAGLIVIVFKLMYMMNAFTGLAMGISGIFYLDSMHKIDQSMRTIPFITASDVSIYYSSMIIVSIMFGFSLLSYILGYKIGKSRLTEWKFQGQDIKNRELREYNTVVHKEKGKLYWWIQNSWDAFKQVVLKQRHEISFEGGDITDTFQSTQAKNIPENNDSHKELRAMDQLINSIKSKMAFKVEPKDIPENIKYYSKKELDKLKKTELMDVAQNIGLIVSGTKKEYIEQILARQKEIKRLKFKSKFKIKSKKQPDIERQYNFESWKFSQDGNILKPSTPIIMLDGNPEFKEIYTKEDYDKIHQELDDTREEIKKAIDGDDFKKAEERSEKFHFFRKKKPKPIGYAVKIKLSNANAYDVNHFINEAKFLPTLSKKYTKKDQEVHRLNMMMEVETTEKAHGMIEERDRQYRALKERKKEQSGGSNVQSKP